MPGERDETQFRKWLNEHRGILLKIAGSFTSSVKDRNDLIQEIMIRLWATMPSFRGRSKPSTWIDRMALNRALIAGSNERKCYTISNLTRNEYTV